MSAADKAKEQQKLKTANQGMLIEIDKRGFAADLTKAHGLRQAKILDLIFKAVVPEEDQQQLELDFERMVNETLTAMLREIDEHESRQRQSQLTAGIPGLAQFTRPQPKG